MRLDHVGIAVEDAGAAKALFQRLFGLPLSLERTVPDQGVKVVKLSSGTRLSGEISMEVTATRLEFASYVVSSRFPSASIVSISRFAPS